PLVTQRALRLFERLGRDDGCDVEPFRLLVRVPGEGFRGAVERCEIQVEVGRENGVGRAVEELTVTSLARPQGLPGAYPVADVVCQHEIQSLARPIERRHGDLDVDDRAVFGVMLSRAK